MSYETNKKEKEIGIDLSTLIIWEVGIVFALLMVVMTVYLYGLYLRVENAESARKLYTPRLAEVANIKLEQQYQISRYSWIDQDKGLVSIPIDLAMDKTARLLSNQRLESTGSQTIIPIELYDLEMPEAGSGAVVAPPGE